ncbi:MAG: hypothetical protein IJU76_06695 [Desulfovibrionaceae bacterium]|nr:hypothetical protein [Desulfovibrionaceae bacterium]
MCIHGFRAIASTRLNEQGFRSDVLEAKLAHVQENHIRGAYNRTLSRRTTRHDVKTADYLDSLKNGAGKKLTHLNKIKESDHPNRLGQSSRKNPPGKRKGREHRLRGHDFFFL